MLKNIIYKLKYIKTYEAVNGITFQQWLKNNPQDINTTEIQCDNQYLIDLDGVQEFKNLKKLWCYGNNLTSLNLKGLDVLKELSCFNNNLTSLNLEGLNNLEELYCENNKLPYEDLEGYWEWFAKEYPERWEARKFNF